MPVYDYHCNACGNDYEAYYAMSERKTPESEPCRACGELKVVMRIATPAIGYSNKGSMKTTDSFNDRLKEIKKNIPPKYHDTLNHNIR